MFGPALRSGLVSGVASLGGPASSPCHRGYTGVGSRPVRARCKSDIRVKGEVEERDGPVTVTPLMQHAGQVTMDMTICS